jgi:hypothetical protein
MSKEEQDEMIARMREQQAAAQVAAAKAVAALTAPALPMRDPVSLMKTTAT